MRTILPTISRFTQGDKLLSIAMMILLEDSETSRVLPTKKIQGTLLDVVTNKSLTPQLHINHFSEHQMKLIENMAIDRAGNMKDGIVMIYTFRDKSCLHVQIKSKGQMARPMNSPGFTTL